MCALSLFVENCLRFNLDIKHLYFYVSFIDAQLKIDTEIQSAFCFLRRRRLLGNSPIDPFLQNHNM